jgi:lipid-A-disaccharide synthase
MAVLPRNDLFFAMVAGEASGDMLAGLLLGALLRRWPAMKAAGIGGPRMTELGFDAWWPHHTLAVHGFSWEVLRRYREIVAIRSALKVRLLRSPRPDVFVGVDAPDFNLDLEHDLRVQGIRTVHFVSPSVWAWRAERMEKIRRSADRVLCLFPFEPELLARHGIAATYVGHPLASSIPMHVDRAAARAAFGLTGADLVVALLPGSRRSEIAHLAPRFLAAALRIQQARPDVKFLLPAVPDLQPMVESAVRASGLTRNFQLVQGQSHAVLAACDVTLVASGTATLEAALYKRPMVIAYHMGWLSWQLMRRKKLQPWVGLPNILCGGFVVPEFLQDAATPQALAQAMLQWLDLRDSRPEQVSALEARFSELHTELKRDTAQLACDAIQEVLQS